MKVLQFSLIVLILFLTSCMNDRSGDLADEISFIENGLLPGIRIDGDSIKQYNINDRMAYYNVPGVSIAIVEDGKIKWAKGYGIANTESGAKVDVNTIFQAGSISKPVAALSALKLLEEGVIDLDVDVSSYLTDWKIPESRFTTDEKVTLRRLLTHSAGMTVHGFPGYQQTDTFPSINMVLNGVGNTPPVFVDTIPGSIWRYSGGGYTVMEKTVEDVSGLPLEEYMEAHILRPIGMTNSSYEQPLKKTHSSNVSAAYDSKGELLEGLWHNYPEQAAAGLWTTPSDLAKYCIEIQEILSGKQNGVLSKKTVELMLTKHKDDWGLGPRLQWENDSLIFRHGGKNAGFTNDMIAFAWKGRAVIVMTNADRGGSLYGEILRSVSKYYDWGISNQRSVETIELPSEELEKLSGRYKLDFQVPEIGDYIIEVVIKGKRLVVKNPHDGDSNSMAALAALEFIDVENGDKVEFQLDKDAQGLLWNNRFQFYKLD